MSALHDAWERLSDGAKLVGDGLAIGAVVGVFFNVLTHATALLSFVYIALRIWEMETVRRWTGRDPGMKALRKFYDETASEPVPDRLNDTLKTLK